MNTYYGESNIGNERGSGSSRKSKKNNPDKPKQPQRGLGVAQLEKIRLHGQLGYHPSLHGAYSGNYNQTRLGDYDVSSSRYGDAYSSGGASWNTVNNIYEAQHYNSQPYSATRHFLNPPQTSTKKHRSDFAVSSNYSEASDAQELDLELRLSL